MCLVPLWVGSLFLDSPKRGCLHQLSSWGDFLHHPHAPEDWLCLLVSEACPVLLLRSGCTAARASARGRWFHGCQLLAE